MTKFPLIAGSVAAALAVILGAFGAHALREKIPAENLQVFETGVRYQMYHAFALIAVFLLGTKLNSSILNYSTIFFFLGIIFFCGSVYLLACRELLGIESWRPILGPITPLGGLCFIIGWICVITAAIKTEI
jgi:uncharacterized membrane protein YgdD (TMEM256/DUF423 family)